MAGEFPFVAKIIYGGYRVGCTGSLITPDKVLTAGHCVDRYGGGYDLELSVGFGNIRTENPSLPPPTGAPGQYRVEKILHPEYSTQENDIAILRLETAVEDIQPVRILTLKEELQLAPSGSRLGVAVGWGSTHPSGSGGELSGTLQTIADLPIYTAADCQQVIDDLREQGKHPQPPAIHEKVLCAGEEGRATGTGDSGGPLLVQTPEGWAQVGVLSQVTRDPYPQTVTYMAQYTRTSHFPPPHLRTGAGPLAGTTFLFCRLPLPGSWLAGSPPLSGHQQCPPSDPAHWPLSRSAQSHPQDGRLRPGSPGGLRRLQPSPCCAREELTRTLPGTDPSSDRSDRASCFAGGIGPGRHKVVSIFEEGQRVDNRSSL